MLESFIQWQVQESEWEEPYDTIHFLEGCQTFFLSYMYTFFFFGGGGCKGLIRIKNRWDKVKKNQDPSFQSLT